MSGVTAWVGLALLLAAGGVVWALRRGPDDWPPTDGPDEGAE